MSSRCIPLREERIRRRLDQSRQCECQYPESRRSTAFLEREKSSSPLVPVTHPFVSVALLKSMIYTVAVLICSGSKNLGFAVTTLLQIRKLLCVTKSTPCMIVSLVKFPGLSLPLRCAGHAPQQGNEPLAIDAFSGENRSALS